MLMSDQQLDEAKELARNIESIDRIASSVDDWNPSKTSFSMFANYEDGANLHIEYFNTPSQSRRYWYDFDVTPF